MLRLLIALLLLLALITASSPEERSAGAGELDQLVDRFVAQEARNLAKLREFTPMVETYVQLYRSDKDLGRVPVADHYFLGRASFKSGIKEEDFLSTPQASLTAKIVHRFLDLEVHNRASWVPAGFAQMAVIDFSGFDRQHYQFTFQHREFLGELRCLVFDVVPRANTGRGRFLGRIWVEDHNFNIVRFDGTYLKPRDRTLYLHFDSWRTRSADGSWLPSYIYAEDAAVRLNGKTSALRSQTRLWNYAASRRSPDELTAILIDSKDAVTDQTTTGAMAPVATERAWLHQAENNVLDRMERAGILAPPAEVESVLETVVNNLIVSNDVTVDPQVRCRVLLTTPIESFTVGHTIVLSRGLLDVLPDEAALAAILARELGHILLAHDIDSRLGFSDSMLFPDDQVLSRLVLKRDAQDEAEADKKAFALLQDSPYKEKLASAGLFLQQIQASRESLPNLLGARIGSSLADNGSRLPELVAASPKLDPANTQQVAALPLGARIELDPWTSKVMLTKAKGDQVLNAHDKMPLQLTPFHPYLTNRFQNGGTAAAASPANR
jgi:hypothetical protein